MNRLIARLDDALNPIVVKELRQAVRGRFLAGILIFFLAVQLATLGIYLLSKGISSIDLVGGESYGEEVFGILAGILFFATVFCVPVYAAVRIYSERRGDGMALFHISTISPRRIVAGKLASNLVLSLLLFSACLPYLSFTYFLRGIDLPTVFVALSVGLMASVAGVQTAVFMASLQVTRMLRILIGLGGLSLLFVLWIAAFSTAVELSQAGVGSRLGSWSFWGPAMTVLFVGALLFGLVFSLSVAIITHGAANRARPVRLYALAAWLVTTAVTGYICFVHAERDVVQAWVSVILLLLAASYLPAVSARDRMSVRVAGEVPCSSVGRLAAFFLFSGSANGVAFTTLMIGLTVGVAAIFDHQLGNVLGELPSQHLGLCAYLLAYSLIGMLLQRHVLHRWIRPGHTWVVVLVLVAIASLTPPILGFLFAPDALSRSLNFDMWLILNPFAPFQSRLGELALRFALGLAATSMVLAGRWFLAQVRAFAAAPAERAASGTQALISDSEA